MKVSLKKMHPTISDICKNTRLLVLLFLIVAALMAAAIFTRYMMAMPCCGPDTVVASTDELDASVMDGMMQPMTQETITETLADLNVKPAMGVSDGKAKHEGSADSKAVVTSPVDLATETSEMKNKHLYVMADGSVLPAGKDVTAGVTAVLEATVDMADVPRWKRNASTGHIYDMSKPMIAIVIDDVGVVGSRSVRAVRELPKAVTLSFLPYGAHTESLVKEAKDIGHDIMIHIPMEPKKASNGKMIYPGDDALYVDLSLAEIKRLTIKNLDTLKDVAVGANNHMGSRFTEYSAGMNVVLEEIDREGLVFLDSITSGKTVVSSVIKKYPSVPFIKRDKFIDHFQEADKVLDYLNKLEKIAKSKGFAVGIGHPHTITTDTLLKWIPTLEAKGIQLVPISAVLKKGIK